MLEKWIRKRNRNVSSVNNTADDSIDDGDNNSRNKIHIVITTYELAIKDMHVLSKLRRGTTSWQYLVVCPRMYCGMSSDVMYYIMVNYIM